ncbi:hypothetical protein M9458_023586, partial [Cirrhinus mrigala]
MNVLIISVYRVIRNQPPPVLSINLDHNPYKCGAPGCAKSFRKAKLLHYHMKYYHGDDRLMEPDQTRAIDKHTTLNNQDSSKKKCITSHEDALCCTVHRITNDQGESARQQHTFLKQGQRKEVYGNG